MKNFQAKKMMHIVGKMVPMDPKNIPISTRRSIYEAMRSKIGDNVLDTANWEQGIITVNKAHKNVYMDEESPVLSPMNFIEKMYNFLLEDGIWELHFNGEFTITVTGEKPSITHVYVNKGQLTYHEAHLIWMEPVTFSHN